MIVINDIYSWNPYRLKLYTSHDILDKSEPTRLANEPAFHPLSQSDDYQITAFHVMNTNRLINPHYPHPKSYGLKPLKWLGYIRLSKLGEL